VLRGDSYPVEGQGRGRSPRAARSSTRGVGHGAGAAGFASECTRGSWSCATTMWLGWPSTSGHVSRRWLNQARCVSPRRRRTLPLKEVLSSTVPQADSAVPDTRSGYGDTASPVCLRTSRDDSYEGPAARGEQGIDSEAEGVEDDSDAPAPASAALCEEVTPIRGKTNHSTDSTRLLTYTRVTTGEDDSGTGTPQAR
jgi:hypothetical protein